MAGMGLLLFLRQIVVINITEHVFYVKTHFLAVEIIEPQSPKEREGDAKIYLEASAEVIIQDGLKTNLRNLRKFKNRREGR